MAAIWAHNPGLTGVAERLQPPYARQSDGWRTDPPDLRDPHWRTEEKAKDIRRRGAGSQRQLCMAATHLRKFCAHAQRHGRAWSANGSMSSAQSARRHRQGRLTPKIYQAMSPGRLLVVDYCRGAKEADGALQAYYEPRPVWNTALSRLPQTQV